MMKSVAFWSLAILFAFPPAAGALAESGLVAPSESAPIVAAAENLPLSADPIRTSQAETVAQFSPEVNSPPATQGDIRRVEERIGRIEKQMDQMRAEMREIRQAMREDFRWLLAAIIALLGLPQLPSWINRLRGNGHARAAS